MKWWRRGRLGFYWIPAFAGMTEGEGGNDGGGGGNDGGEGGNDGSMGLRTIGWVPGR